MKKMSLFVLVLLLVMTSCEKKTAEITVDSLWTGSMEVQKGLIPPLVAVPAQFLVPVQCPVG